MYGKETEYNIREMHEGVSGAHDGGTNHSMKNRKDRLLLANYVSTNKSLIYKMIKMIETYTNPKKISNTDD